MTSIWFAIAALLGVATFCVHTFVGGKVVARPLLAGKHLPPASKWLNYMCWHITTVFLIIAAVTFGWMALQPFNLELAILLSVLCGSASGVSIWVALKAGINPLRFPSTSMLGGLALLGLLGILNA